MALLDYAPEFDYIDGPVRLYRGDCIEVMREIPSGSIDAIVTDPPYGLGFMGKHWDALPPGLPWALECLRVLKPGGHLLAFGGTRTWHRLAVAVEDAGFEIRDSIAWLYGSGFPKSLDVGKAIDARPGVQHHAEFAAHLTERRESAGLSPADVSEHVVGSRSGACWNWEHHQFPEAKWWPALSLLLDMAPEWGALVAAAERVRTGTHASGLQTGSSGVGGGGAGADRHDNASTEAAAQWHGWGTALKPAFEPVVVGRKPLVGTVAANVLAHGTGAINVDGCRVEAADAPDTPVLAKNAGSRYVSVMNGGRVSDAEPRTTSATSAGRWPTNVILDQSQADALDEQSGIGKSSGRPRNNGEFKSVEKGAETAHMTYGHSDSGGASRFFYVAKAPKSERPIVDGIAHPTVKPLAIMRHLVKLVTPPGGVVLDPFAGSGTTIEAAMLEGFDVIGIEREAEYLPLIVQRIRRAG